MADDSRVDTQSTTELSAYKIGKALLDSARARSRVYTSSFHDDQKFALGENHWALPANYRALFRSKWKNQGVRNYIWAVIHQKLAFILTAEPQIRAEPMRDNVTLEEREDAATVTRHALQLLKWRQQGQAALTDGLITGTGITHIYPTMNEVTQRYDLNLELVDPQRFYKDPSKDRLHEGRFAIYHPELDMSDVRKYFPDTWKLVKPKEKQIGKMGDIQYGRSAEELIYGSGSGELILRDGAISERKADVAFVYIKDVEVVSELKDVVVKDPMPGFQCSQCGRTFEEEEGSFTPGSPMPSCPDCQSTEVSRTMLPPVMEEMEQRSNKYPYGRLICLTDDALLYDGPNRVKIREIFPFSEYINYFIPRRPWGYGEVAMLRTVQESLNRNIAQGIDFMRLAGNGPMEVPAEVQAYRHLGNRPGDVVPVPFAFMGRAHYIAPTGYNPQMHQIIDGALKADMNEVSGVTPVMQGLAPSDPSSGREVEVRAKLGSTRLGLQLSEYNAYASTVASIVYQMKRQFDPEEANYHALQPNGTYSPKAISPGELPEDLRILVESDPDRTEKDNLLGQNVNGFIGQGGLDSPYGDIMLRMIAKGDKALVREIMERKSILDEQAKQAAQEEAEAAAATPEAAPQPGSAEGLIGAGATGGIPNAG